MPLLARLIYAATLRRARRRFRASGLQPDSVTGRQGETLAYWLLRSQGYIMVGRNLRLRPGLGELDLVGWDGPVLAFIEVKTRASLAGGQPEEAVAPAQRRRIIRAAEAYVRRLRRREINYRFDIVSVALHENDDCRVRLIKNAFSSST